MALSRERAARLAPLLEALAARPWQRRIEADPIEFPRRYRDPRDIETVALLSASLAYGRADLFKPKIAALLDRLGPSPASTLRGLTVTEARDLTAGFVYRFNVPADVATLLLGMGVTLRQHGSLESAFLAGLSSSPLPAAATRTARTRASSRAPRTTVDVDVDVSVNVDVGVNVIGRQTAAPAPGSWRAALSAFTTRIVASAPRAEIRRRLGPERGLAHLLPVGDGAQKRLNLFLRWMVRGPDGVDLGVWRRVSPSALVIPLDTHLARISRLLGLTRRSDQSWRTAEEITASLRLIDPRDPVRFDFALCHFGMSGECPAQPVRATCRACALRRECRVGRALR